MSYDESSVGLERRHYYSSSQGPFHNANNIFLFYGGGERAEIVETIMRSLRVDDHLITVHGERGSGKTMLALVLADRLKHRCNIIRYDLQQLSVGLLVRHLLIEICPQQAEMLSAEEAAGAVDSNTLEAARQCLVMALQKPAPGNKPYVFTVDSTADADAASLQFLHDLAAVRCGNDPALHVVLFRRVDAEAARVVSAHSGINQPEHHYWLRRLSLTEINEYLQHHMLLFDFNQRGMFTRDMAYFIADRSEGVFRAINTLARNAFMIASLEDSERVSMSHLLMAGLPARPDVIAQPGFITRHRGGVIALLGSCVVLSVATLVLLN